MPRFLTWVLGIQTHIVMIMEQAFMHYAISLRPIANFLQKIGLYWPLLTPIALSA